LGKALDLKNTWKSREIVVVHDRRRAASGVPGAEFSSREHQMFFRPRALPDPYARFKFSPRKE
jgi:hypothetical protein